MATSLLPCIASYNPPVTILHHSVHMTAHVGRKQLRISLHSMCCVHLRQCKDVGWSYAANLVPGIRMCCRPPDLTVRSGGINAPIILQEGFEWHGSNVHILYIYVLSNVHQRVWACCLSQLSHECHQPGGLVPVRHSRPSLCCSTGPPWAAPHDTPRSRPHRWAGALGMIVCPPS